MKRYCPSCGSPTEYSLKKPQFCCNCGKSFDNNNQISEAKTISNEKIVSRVRPIINQKIKNIQNEESYDNDDYDNGVNYVPNLNHLEVETFAEKTKVEKIGDLMKSPSKPNKRGPKTKLEKISNKKILEDFKKEAGSIKRSK